MSRENVDLVRGMYLAFGEGRIDDVLEAMDPQIEWREADNHPYADGNPYVGPQSVLAGVFARLEQEWESFALAIDEVFDAGDTVVVLGRYSGEHAESGEELDAQFAHVWKLRDGKATGFQQYTDTAQFASVAGPA